MKKIILSSLCIVTLLVFSQSPSGYYDNTENITGQALKEALYDTIKDHTEYPYTSSSTDVWNILRKSNMDPDDSANVILVYTNQSVNGAQEYNSGKGWSREHVWAKSHGNFGTSIGAGTDLHNLMPADISVNSARNNRDYDDGGDRYYDNGGLISTDCFSTTYSWEPREDVKGDVARAIFYMATRYNGDNNEPQLSIANTTNTIALCDNENAIGYMGKLSTLLAWHIQDPVDDFEIQRNNVIYTYQNNRNPFIDHPEYVLKIWGDITQTNDIFTDNYTLTHKGKTLKICTTDTKSTILYLYDTKGQLLLSKTFSTNTSCEVLHRGLYIVLIKQGNSIFRTKIAI